MKIYSKIYSNKKIICGLVMLLCIVCMAALAMAASAITVKSANVSFIIDAELLSAYSDAYNLQMTIENQGDDWEGIVRVEVCGDYDTYYETAYDTAIVLPQDSVKQFVVKIPMLERSTDRQVNTIKATLYDNKLRKAGEKVFKDILPTDEAYMWGQRNSGVLGMLEFFGNGIGHLNFNGIRVIIILYVFFAGPLLYLILRFIKKRDFYWILVSVTALVTIFLVYLAGRGYEVVNTKVYSVTVRDLSENYGDMTFMHCYDAGHKEWNLKLAERYEYIGCLKNNYNYDDEGTYYYHILKEGSRLSFGINPNESFEDCYFQAKSEQTVAKGNTSSGIDFKIDDTGYTLNGEVGNKTDYDFKYFAVCSSEYIAIYKDLQAGDKCDLSSENAVYFSRGVDYDLSKFYRLDVMGSVCDDDKLAADIDVLSALGMGVIEADYNINNNNNNNNKVFIVGVVENWENAVDDNCSETAYGCLYSVN